MEFEIQDCKAANWAIEKIAEHRRAIIKYEAMRDDFIKEYEKRIETAQQNCDEDCEEHIRAIENLKFHLREYAAKNLPEGKKTLKLPEGKLRFTSSPVCYRFKNGEKPASNNQQLIDYLQANATEFIKTSYSADWVRFKRELDFDKDSGDVFNKKTGEVIKDLFAEKAPDKFDVLTEDA